MLLFALPIFVGNLLSVVFGWVDGILLTSYVSEDALAASAVGGTVYSIGTIFASAFPVGMTSLTSKIYGEKNPDKLRKNYLFSIILNAVFAIIDLVISLALIGPLLQFMHLSDSPAILELARKSAYVGCFSIVGLMFYSFLVIYLRSLGERQMPLVFIIIYTLVGALCDFLYMGVAKWGIYAPALASLTAYLVCDVFGFLWIFFRHKELRIKKEDWKIDWEMIKKQLSLSLPLAFELCFISIAGLFSQSFVDGLGKEALLGLTVAGKLTGMTGLYINGINSASGTFMAQNIGQGQNKRAKEGLNKALFICLGMLVIDLLMSFFLIDPVINVFLKNPSETTIYYCRLSVYFNMGCLVMLPFIGCFRFSLQAVEKPVWNLIAGVAQLAVHLICLYVFSTIYHEYAIVGATFFAQLIPLALMVVGSIISIYHNPSLKVDKIVESKKEVLSDEQK